MPPPYLSVMIVNWNGGEVLLDCIGSVFHNPPTCSFEVILVDNASSDDSLMKAAQEFPGLHIILNEVNKGFAAGNNRAAQAAQSELFLLLNSDTRVQPGAIDRLIEEIKAFPQTALVGPKLLNSDGSLQPSRGIFPNLLTEFLDNTLLYRAVPVLKGGKQLYTQAGPADWISGACFLVRREAYEQVGGLDEGYFMFLEDVDFCRRLKLAGWEVRYTPAAEVIHRKGFSSQPVLPEMLLEDQRSAYRFFRLHYGAPYVWAERLIVSFGCLVRGLAWLSVAIVRQRHRSHAMRRVRALFEIFRRSWIDPAFVWGTESRG